MKASAFSLLTLCLALELGKCFCNKEVSLRELVPNAISSLSNPECLNVLVMPPEWKSMDIEKEVNKQAMQAKEKKSCLSFR